MKRVYADDLTGKNPDNISTGQLSTEMYPNKYNLVVPPSAPFYRNGMELTDLAGNPLFEGLDYYLALYYADGAAASRAAVFGGIMLIGHTEVKYKVQAFGSAYSVPETDIGLFLVNPNLTEPRNLDWSSLLRWKIPVPEMGAPGDFEEAVRTDKIIAAVMQLRDLLGDNGEKLDAALDNVITELTKVAVRIHEDDLYQHHKTPHEHKYTPEMIGALREDGTAVNAVKIFGRTLAELSAILLQSHVSQAVIDRLYDKAGGFLNGRLHVTGTGELAFVSSSGKQSFRANGQNIVIAADNGDFKLIADRTKNTRGRAIEINAGYNSLLIPSDGAGNTLRPIYNGAFVITEDTTDLYLWAPSVTRANPTFTTTDTLKASGAATQGSPLSFDATPPQATEAKVGLFRLTSSLLLTSPGYALTQKAVTDLRDRLDAYVGETFTVNSKAFGPTQKVELDKSDIGLGNVNNTTFANKPAHQRFRDALLNKALKTHTHVAADLKNVPTASPEVSGLTTLSNLLTDGGANAAVPKLLYDLALDISEGEDEAKNVIPGWVANGTFYGDAGFMPIPTAGQYNGSGSTATSEFAAGLIEDSGVLYILRNGWDGYEESKRVYFWTTKLKADGSLGDTYSPTALQYRPVGLSKYPGVELKAIMVNGEDCGIFQGTDNNYYLVAFEGTADQSKHRRVLRISYGPVKRGNDTLYTGNPSDRVDHVFFAGSDIFVVRAYLETGEFFTCLWKLPLSAMSTESAEFQAVKVTAKIPDGEIGRFTTYSMDTEDPNTTALFYTTPEGKSMWPNARNALHGSRRCWMFAREGRKLRCRSNSRSYVANSSTNRWQDWQISFVIDLDLGSALLDADFLPLKLDTAGFSSTGDYFNYYSHGIFRANSISSLTIGPKFISVVGNNNGNTTDKVYRVPLNDQAPFEAIRYDVNLRDGGGTAIEVIGAFGSDYRYRMRGLAELGGNTKKVLLRQTNIDNCISIKYDPVGSYDVPGTVGFGPTNERIKISRATYDAILKLASVWDGTTSVLSGSVFIAPGTMSYKNVAGTTTVTTDTMTLTAAEWEKANTAIGGLMPVWTDPNAQYRAAQVNVYGVGKENLCFIAAMATLEENGIKYVYWRICKVGMTFVNGNVILDTDNVTPIYTVNRNNSSFVSFSQTFAHMYWQARLIKQADGWIIRLPFIGYTTQVGSGGGTNFSLDCDLNFQNWNARIEKPNAEFGESDLVLVQETGETLRADFSIGAGLYYGGDIYPAGRNWASGESKKFVMFGPQLAEGLNLYFTETVFFFANAKEYRAPQTNFELEPSTTTYFHVYLENGAVKYKAGGVIEKDTDTQLYIGYAVTNTVSIVETNIQRASRLDNVSALAQHAANPYAHDYMRTGSRVPTLYDGMENKPLFKEQGVKPVSMANMFNDFVKFSHSPTKPDQPATPADAEAWSMPDDYYECTVNTATFTGRISNYLTGDYRMSFLVTGTAAATDNDAGAIIIAAFAKGDIDDREHTLSIVFSGSIETHMNMTGRVELIQDYQTPWAKSLAVLNSDTTSIDWRTLYQHVIVERVGTLYSVAIKSAVLTPETNRLAGIRKMRQNHSNNTLGQVSVNYSKLTFDAAIDAPDFAKAKTRWGFGAYSQQFLQVWPIEEPVRDLNDAYATSASVHEMLKAGNFGSFSIATVPLQAGTPKPWYNNVGGEMWMPVSERASSSANVVNAGAPAHAKAIMPFGNEKAKKVNRFGVVSNLVSATNRVVNLQLVGYVDDTAEFLINGVSVGTGASKFDLSISVELKAGNNALCFIVSEAPNDTPSYIGWGCRESGSSEWLSVSTLADRYVWINSDGSIDGPVGTQEITAPYQANGTCTSTFVHRNKIKDASASCTPIKMSPTYDTESRAAAQNGTYKVPQYADEDNLKLTVTFDRLLTRH